MNAYIGEVAALGTAVCWTVTAISFQHATRKIGSLSVNVLRLIIAFTFFATLSLIIRSQIIPFDASIYNWTWLSISGLVGFVLGDYWLFMSYQYISARVSMLIMSISPLFAAFLSYFVLDESMGWMAILAMMITIGGIFLVVVSRNKNQENPNAKKGMSFSFPVKGLLFALGGAVGQAIGLVLSKYGMKDYDAFSSTFIRVIAGLIGFILVISLSGRWKRVGVAIKDKSAMKYTLFGGFFGPFLGVFLSLYSVKYTSVGVGSTLMSIVPIMIIPPMIFIYKEKVSLKEILGAIIAVIGVSLFFM